MRDESLEAKQKRAVTSQQTYIHAVRSSRSYVLACGVVHAPSACRASPPAPRATSFIRTSGIALCAPCCPIHPPVERRYLRPTIPSACRTAVLCAPLLHPSVRRTAPPARPATPSARRAAPSAPSAPFAPCYPIRSASSRFTAVYFFSGMGSSLPSCRVTLQRVTSRTKAGLTR